MRKLKNLNIAIFLDRDVTIRHFLDSNIFCDLKNNNNLKLVFPPIGDKRIKDHKNPEKFGFEYEFIKIPERRIQLWKWIFFIKILTFRKGEDWKIIRKVYSKAIGNKMSILFKISSIPFLRSLVITLIKTIIDNYKIDDLYKFFNNFKPDIIIHPSTFHGIYINELALISKRLNIPYILLMNSWDNPCLKNTSVYEPTIVGVWGEQTASHAHKYMGLANEKIKILGAAQFQCFNDKFNMKREAIFDEYEFSKDTILVLYAGSSMGNNEFRHLKFLEKICLEIDKKIRIIYRPHPWLSDIETAKKILNMNSKIIKIDKLMTPFLKKLIKNEINSFYSTEYKYTHDLLGASDIVISPLSTILIEALCHGNESICLIPKDEESRIFLKEIKNLPCFQDVIKSRAIKTIENIEDLKEALLLSYKNCRNPETKLKNKQYANFFVDMKKSPYKERLSRCIEELVNE